MKHKITSTVSTLVLIATLVFAPTMSFAATGQAERNNNIFAAFASQFDWHTRIARAETKPVVNKAPSISGVTAPTVLKAGVEGTWSVSASDPENGALSYAVDWGDQNIMARMFAAPLAFTQTSTFTHTYDTPGVYTVRFTVKDDAGKSSSSSVSVRIVENETLAITEVAGDVKSETQAKITWRTNARSDSRVFYSATSPVDISSASSKGNSGKVLQHSITLNGLTAGTKYFYLVQSKKADGTVATSAEYSFTTPNYQNRTPSIESITGPETLAANTEGTWTVVASDPENSSLSYSIDWGENTSMMRALKQAEPAFAQTSTFSHTYAESGTYTITVTVKDESGLTATSTTTVVVTSPATPIALSGISAFVGVSNIKFDWTTNVKANSEVYYATASPVTIGGANTVVKLDTTAATAHSLNVDGLAAGTTYYFIIQSKDSEGATAATSQFSLTTMSM